MIDPNCVFGIHSEESAKQVYNSTIHVNFGVLSSGESRSKIIHIRCKENPGIKNIIPTAYVHLNPSNENPSNLLLINELEYDLTHPGLLFKECQEIRIKFENPFIFQGITEYTPFLDINRKSSLVSTLELKDLSYDWISSSLLSPSASCPLQVAMVSFKPLSTTQGFEIKTEMIGEWTQEKGTSLAIIILYFSGGHGYDSFLCSLFSDQVS